MSATESQAPNACDAIKLTPYAKRVQERGRIPPMLPETREQLEKHFEGPNAELAAFLGRDLHEWRR